MGMATIGLSFRNILRLRALLILWNIDILELRKKILLRITRQKLIRAQLKQMQVILINSKTKNGRQRNRAQTKTLSKRLDLANRSNQWDHLLEKSQNSHLTRNLLRSCLILNQTSTLCQTLTSPHLKNLDYDYLT